MRFLLDTCTFLWATNDSVELSPRARAIFQDPESYLALSPVSAWEIAVKHGMGRLPLPEEPAVFVPTRRAVYGIASLPFDEESALHVQRLPAIHKDPFDRLLISQAVVHGFTLLTPDPLIVRYGVRTVW